MTGKGEGRGKERKIGGRGWAGIRGNGSERYEVRKKKIERLDRR